MVMAAEPMTAKAGQHADKWDGKDVSVTMISLTAKKRTINKKYHEGFWMGSSSPLVRCCSGLRRIGRGPPQMGTNNGSGVAS